MELPSHILENAIQQFAKFPGVGRKSAIRMVLHLAKRSALDLDELNKVVTQIKQDLKVCKRCHVYSDEEVCRYCAEDSRANGLLCIVQDIRDVVALEASNQYKGRYHVLNGLISPMDGVGPDGIYLQTLPERIEEEEIREVIFALPDNIEGRTTEFYIARMVAKEGLHFSQIARGVSVGSELEFTDEVTLARSIAGRIPFSL